MSLIFMIVIGCLGFDSAQTSFDIQGHRGCRGLMPENTIPAFIKAMELGVTTLELDLVISKDRKVVVSHEAYFRAGMSIDPNGEVIPKDREREFNLYEMPYDSIRDFDVGSLPDPGYPDKALISTFKPLLSEVVQEVRDYCEANNRTLPYFNIEIKRTPQGDGVYHPGPVEFVDLVLEQVSDLEIEKFTTLQSFDFESLRLTKERAPELTIAMLIMNRATPEENVRELGFKPDIYSSYFKLVDNKLIEYCKSEGIKVIPWTVNEESDIDAMIEMGVDGIISDYPDRVLAKTH